MAKKAKDSELRTAVGAAETAPEVVPKGKQRGRGEGQQTFHAEEGVQTPAETVAPEGGNGAEHEQS